MNGMIRTPEWWARELGKLVVTALTVAGAIVLMAAIAPERLPQ